MKYGEIVYGGLKESSRTVNFNNSMTAAEIQALINEQPRYIPYEKSLFFQFADGTYNLDTPLVFDGFFGGGYIYVQGNTSETADLHTDQAVFLDFSSNTNINGISVRSCTLFNFTIRFLKIRSYGSSGETGAAIQVSGVSGVSIWYCYCIGNSNSHVHIEFKRSFGYVYKTYVSGGASNGGIQSDDGSMVYSSNNDDTGTQPVYGLDARDGGVIAKNGTQPSGSTADEHTQTGGVIR